MRLAAGAVGNHDQVLLFGAPLWDRPRVADTATGQGQNRLRLATGPADHDSAEEGLAVVSVMTLGQGHTHYRRQQ